MISLNLRIRQSKKINYLDVSHNNLFDLNCLEKIENITIKELNLSFNNYNESIQKIKTTSYPNNIEWIGYFEWCTNWNISLKIEIETSLKYTESSLSDVRVFWIGQLVELQKAKMAFPKFGEYFNIEDLKQLITYIAKIGLNRTTMQELDRTQKRSLTGQ